MDNKEFEKKLEQIKIFKKVPVSVDEKIQKALEKIEENEKLEKEIKKSKNKFNFSRILSLAASFVMAIFLAGNGVAYAKGEPNIYSWILEKVGIQKEYEEIKTEVNKTVESDNIEITLIDLGYDSNSLIIGLKIKDKEGKLKTTPSNKRKEFENEQEYIKYVIDNMIFSEYYEIFTTGTSRPKILGNLHSIHDGGATTKFSNELEEKFDVENVIEKTSENSYVLYKIIDISKTDFKGEITKINIYLDSIYSQAQMVGGEIVEPISQGDWYFEVNDLTKENNEYTQHMVILEEQIDNVLKINSIEIKNAKVFDIIKFDTDITTIADGTFIAAQDVLYFSKIVDENNNVLGEVQDSALGFYYRINNLNINKEYKLLVYKVDMGEDKDYNYNKYLEGKLEPIDTILFKLNDENRLINTYKFEEEIVYATNDVSENKYKIEKITIENYKNKSIIKYNSDGSKYDCENIIRIVNENNEIKCEFNHIANEDSKVIDLLKEGKYRIKIYEYEPDYTKYDPVYEEAVYSEEDLKLVATSEFELK